MGPLTLWVITFFTIFLISSVFAVQEESNEPTSETPSKTGKRSTFKVSFGIILLYNELQTHYLFSTDTRRKSRG